MERKKLKRIGIEDGIENKTEFIQSVNDFVENNGNPFGNKALIIIALDKDASEEHAQYCAYVNGHKEHLIEALSYFIENDMQEKNIIEEAIKLARKE
jgi:hypothetical protein